MRRDRRADEGRAGDNLGLVAREDPVDEVLSQVEPTAERPQQRDLVLERLRLFVGPRHPRAQLIDARVHSLLEGRRVVWLPAAYDETVGHDTGTADGSRPVL